MSERKVLNKYYPPDFDPSKIPRAKLPKNRQYTVRLMAPFNMRCKTCGEYIYKGKKFNARKEDVENETYLGIRIYRFYIKCTRCLQEISFKTDPQNTDYEIEAGATRNFMALKLALEQEEREEQEAREEEKNNPMKLLEARTEQSRNEIEILESLEELKYLNKRQQEIDYDSMLEQFKPNESAREREERLKKLDDEYIKTIKFGSSDGGGVKRAVGEDAHSEPDDFKRLKEEVLGVRTTAKTSITKPSLSIGAINKKPSLQGLIKRKVQPTASTAADTSTQASSSTSSAPSVGGTSLTAAPIVTSSSVSSKVDDGKEVKPSGGLSLLGAYSDSDDSSET